MRRQEILPFNDKDKKTIEEMFREIYETKMQQLEEAIRAITDLARGYNPSNYF